MTEDQQKARKAPISQVEVDEERSRITLPKKIDIQFMENADGLRAQSMQGFNPRYKDFVDYIIGITHEIHEEKAIGMLYDYYANTIQVHFTSGYRLRQGSGIRQDYPIAGRLS